MFVFSSFPASFFRFQVLLEFQVPLLELAVPVSRLLKFAAELIPFPRNHMELLIVGGCRGEVNVQVSLEGPNFRCGLVIVGDGGVEALAEEVGVGERRIAGRR